MMELDYIHISFMYLKTSFELEKEKKNQKSVKQRKCCFLMKKSIIIYYNTNYMIEAIYIYCIISIKRENKTSYYLYLLPQAYQSF